MAVEEDLPGGQGLRFILAAAVHAAGKRAQGAGQAQVGGGVVPQAEDVGGAPVLLPVHELRGGEGDRQHGEVLVIRAGREGLSPGLRALRGGEQDPSGILLQEGAGERRALFRSIRKNKPLTVLPGPQLQEGQDLSGVGEHELDGRSQNAQAHQLEEHADHAPEARDRVEITVSDGRERRDRVPQRVGQCPDRGAVRAGLGEEQERDQQAVAARSGRDQKTSAVLFHKDSPSASARSISGTIRTLSRSICR